MSQLKRLFSYFSLGVGIALAIAYWLKQEALGERQQLAPPSPSATPESMAITKPVETHIILSQEALDAAEAQEESSPPAPAAPPEPKTDTEPAPDDLTAIYGIGPKTAEALHSAGITTFAALASSDAVYLAEKLQDIRGVNADKLRDWIKQAKEQHS